MPKGLGPLDRKLWGAFCVADLDGSGAISRKELAYAFRLAGLTSTTAEKRAVFREADLNRDGVLTRTRTRTRARPQVTAAGAARRAWEAVEAEAAEAAVAAAEAQDRVGMMRKAGYREM